MESEEKLNLVDIPLEQSDFLKYGLTVFSEKKNHTVYRKPAEENEFIEIWDFRGTITINLIDDTNYKSVIASRYDCRNIQELDFLITRGRVGHHFLKC